MERAETTPPDRAPDRAEDGEARRLESVYDGYRATAGRWSRDNAGNQALLRERQRATLELLRAAGLLPLAGRRVLEVGSGGGAELAWLADQGASAADLVGIDLLPDRVAEATAAHPDLRFQQGDARRLEFPASSFDLVLALTLFSSILDAGLRAAVAAELIRVLRPGGAILWYDLRYGNPRNPNVVGLGQAELRRLFGRVRIEARSITLLPPLARRLGPATELLYPVLASLPPLRSHLLALIGGPT